MYVVIVGAGKVGWNLARELINKRHEVTVIEADAHRYAVVEQELEHSAMYGDGSSCGCSSAPEWSGPTWSWP